MENASSGNGWSAAEITTLEALRRGAEERSLFLTLELYEADEGTPCASFMCRQDAEGIYHITRINGRYIVTNRHMIVIAESSDLYTSLYKQLAPSIHEEKQLSPFA